MNTHPLENAWIVFSHRGRELLRLTAAEATASEVLATCDLLAHERRCAAGEIDISLADPAIDGDGPPAFTACFFDYANTADCLLELVYGRTLLSAGLDFPDIAAAQDAGEPPVHFVIRLAREHDLTPVNA